MLSSQVLIDHSQDRPHLGPRLSKFEKIEIISSIFSDNNAMRLDINCRGEKLQKSTNSWRLNNTFSSVQFSRSVVSNSFSSVAQSCPTLCDPMNRSMPGFPVHHQLPEFTQIQVHRVSDAIQPSHPRSSPSPPAPNPSQHQSLFQ